MSKMSQSWLYWYLLGIDSIMIKPPNCLEFYLINTAYMVYRTSGISIRHTSSTYFAKEKKILNYYFSGRDIKAPFPSSVSTSALTIHRKYQDTVAGFCIWTVFYLNKRRLTWLLCCQRIELGGSGLRRMTQVKLIVLPIPTNTSLPPKIVVLGSVKWKHC